MDDMEQVSCVHVPFQESLAPEPWDCTGGAPPHTPRPAPTGTLQQHPQDCLMCI